MKHFANFSQLEPPTALTKRFSQIAKNAVILSQMVVVTQKKIWEDFSKMIFLKKNFLIKNGLRKFAQLLNIDFVYFNFGNVL